MSLCVPLLPQVVWQMELDTCVVSGFIVPTDDHSDLVLFILQLYKMWRKGPDPS